MSKVIRRPTAGDPTPVTGGCPVPAGIVARGLTDVPWDADETTKHLYRLLELHPDLMPRVRADMVASLSQADKLRLITDINRSLGIARFSVPDGH